MASGTFAHSTEQSRNFRLRLARGVGDGDKDKMIWPAHVEVDSTDALPAVAVSKPIGGSRYNAHVGVVLFLVSLESSSKPKDNSKTIQYDIREVPQRSQ